MHVCETVKQQDAMCAFNSVLKLCKIYISHSLVLELVWFNVGILSY